MKKKYELWSNSEGDILFLICNGTVTERLVIDSSLVEDWEQINHGILWKGFKWQSDIFLDKWRE